VFDNPDKMEASLTKCAESFLSIHTEIDVEKKKVIFLVSLRKREEGTETDLTNTK